MIGALGDVAFEAEKRAKSSETLWTAGGTRRQRPHCIGMWKVWVFVTQPQVKPKPKPPNCATPPPPKNIAIIENILQFLKR
jgi:hypothetical protein